MKMKDWNYWNQKWWDYIGYNNCPECGFRYFIARREDDKREITKGKVVVSTPRGWMCVCCYSEWDWNGLLEKNELR